MSQNQTCPHCNQPNKVAGVFFRTIGKGEDKIDPQILVCGHCGMKFIAKGETYNERDIPRL